MKPSLPLLSSQKKETPKATIEKFGSKSKRPVANITSFYLDLSYSPNAITDKLRMKDGRTREMDAIFQAQDKQLEARGRKILSDRVELRRSVNNIRSSDKLKAEKQGIVGLSGSGGYNPALLRRRSTRLSF